ncbi:hypothetical protein ACFOYU_16645 [Microvirga sp. GCM10011540]|uniref:hypothetical protein n=1 Tax=Microvirga sp. GCM10011540 TaxID=3317338 RepID=UPI00361AFE35
MYPSWRSLRPAVILALSLAASLFSGDVRAEEDYRITNEVVLSDVRVSPAKAGGRTQITFLLENRSAERVLFGGITVADAGQSSIVASLGSGGTTILDSIPVAPGEVLSVDGESLWIKVDRLAKNLQPGGEIEATVNFGAVVIPITLRVADVNKPSN